MSWRIALPAVALGGAVLASCLLPSDPGTIRVSFALPQDTVRVGVADTATPAVSVLSGTTPLVGAHLQYESADTNVLSVNDAGTIRVRARRTAYIRVKLVSVATGATPPVDSFPVRGVVSRLAFAETSATLTSIGDTLTLHPGFLDATGAHFAPADSAAATATLSVQVASTGSAVSVDSTGRIHALAHGTDTLRVQVDTCRGAFVVSVRQRATSVHITPRTMQFSSIGQIQLFSATALDSGGATIAAPQITWSSTAPGVVAVNATGTASAIANGAARLIAAIDSAADTVTVSVSQVPATMSFGVEPSSATAGSAIAPAVTITVADSLGHPVTTANTFVSVALAGGPGGATLSGTLAKSAVNGVATFADLSVDKAGSGYSLVASATGFPHATSNTFGITAGAATKLTFVTQPSRTPKNSIITPPVQVVAQDALGNVVTAFTGSVTISIASGSGGANLSGTLSVPATAGLATFSDLSINKTGTNYKLAVSASGLTTATSAVFAITTPSVLVFVLQPSTTPANTAIAPAIQVAVEDGFGDIATGYSGSVALEILPGTGTSGAALNGTTSVAIVNGVATFSNVSVTLAGSAYQLNATDPANVLADGASGAFDIQ
ncbi:MAG TPA: hypothetical protein VLV45_11580 [Gemmatimonadales bacterium]|nr:hypothetical protein [Gemmatimonadales bacterium]